MLVYDITNEKSFDNIKNWIRNATCKLIKFCLPSSLLLFEHYYPKLLILSSVKIFYILFYLWEGSDCAIISTRLFLHLFHILEF